MGLVLVIMTNNISLIIITVYFLGENEGKLSVCLKSVYKDVCTQRCGRVPRLFSISEIASCLYSNDLQRNSRAQSL
jgi:hypothetical protein